MNIVPDPFPLGSRARISSVIGFPAASTPGSVTTYSPKSRPLQLESGTRLGTRGDRDFCRSGGRQPDTWRAD
jgi:hypothetical protein